MPNYGKATARSARPKLKTSKNKTSKRGSVVVAKATPKKVHRKGQASPREMAKDKADRGSNWEPKTAGARKPRHSSEQKRSRSAASGNSFTSRTERPKRGYQEASEEKPVKKYRSRDSKQSERNPYREDRIKRDDSREKRFAGARESSPNRKAFFEDRVLERLESASEIISEESFQAMDVHPKLVQALSGMGAEVPFPIQKATIPAGLQGRDVLGRGKTGSGKTIAFAIPVISKLVRAGSKPRKANFPKALVLAPTRELADQIDRTMSALARSVGFYTTCVYGGVPQRRQEIALNRGVDILVATPGRLEDLMEQKIINLSEVESVVIDEADHMCDLGFIDGVKRILRATGESQKLLFSATLDKEVDALVKEFLSKPYVYEVPNEVAETSDIEHRVLVVDPDDRSKVLLRLVQGAGKSLIFTRTKATAERLSESLTANGVPAARLHGDLNQNQRTRNLNRFTRGEVRVLVATDVAARGIHVDDVALVIQVDPPEEYKTYLHRSGRTGRAGKAGVVITLIPRAKRRRVEELLRRADRFAKISDIRPENPLLEQLAGPIAPAPVAEHLDFGDSDRGRRQHGERPKRKSNYQGSGKGRWADKPKGEKRPRARKYAARG